MLSRRDILRRLFRVKADVCLLINRHYVDYVGIKVCQHEELFVRVRSCWFDYKGGSLLLFATLMFLHNSTLEMLKSEINVLYCTKVSEKYVFVLMSFSRHLSLVSWFIQRTFLRVSFFMLIRACCYVFGKIFNFLFSVFDFSPFCMSASSSFFNCAWCFIVT